MDKEEQILVLTVGVAGSGKTSYVKRRYSHFCRICMDEIRGRLSLDPADSEQSALAFRYCWKMLRYALRNGESVVWDATSIRLRNREKIISLAKDAGAKVIIIYFDIPEDEILRRNSSRLRKVPKDVITKQLNSLQPPTEEEADEIIVVQAT